MIQFYYKRREFENSMKFERRGTDNIEKKKPHDSTIGPGR